MILQVLLFPILYPGRGLLLTLPLARSYLTEASSNQVLGRVYGQSTCRLSRLCCCNGPEQNSPFSISIIMGSVPRCPLSLEQQLQQPTCRNACSCQALCMVMDLLHGGRRLSASSSLGRDLRKCCKRVEKSEVQDGGG